METGAKIFVLLFALAPMVTSCSFSEIVRGSHQIVTRTVEIKDYDEIELNMSADVIYRQYSEMTPYLEIHTDDNIVDALDIRVSDGKLILEVKDNVSIQPSKLTIYTTSRELEKVKIAGSGDILLQGEVNAKEFKLGIAGSGDFSSDSLYCEKMKVEIGGSGKVNLSGAANEAVVKVAGSGDVNAYGFVITEAKCEVAGSGNININVIGKLDANIAGSGDVRYKGSPAKVNSSVAGSGTISSDN
jgi:hypothetical protein